jgi:hypothetical protein
MPLIVAPPPTWVHSITVTTPEEEDDGNIPELRITDNPVS